MRSVAHRPGQRVTVGVDTHKDTHVAVALDQIGGRLAEVRITADTAGYQRLESWALNIAPRAVFGVEGCGSYGAGLASYLRRRGHRVVEVNRPDRQARHRSGKNDTLDAEQAARAVLAGAATAEVR